jgi:hypothetical protein
MLTPRKWATTPWKRYTLPSDEFTIKDSGSRAEFSGGMVRDNAGDKTDFTGSFIGPMWRRWAEHQTKGRAKYPDPEPGVPNWTKAEGVEELIHAKRSLLRHMTAYMEGKKDEDHAAAIFFNINLIEYIQEKLDVLPVVADPDCPPGKMFVVDKAALDEWAADMVAGVDPSCTPEMTGPVEMPHDTPTEQEMRAAHEYALHPHDGMIPPGIEVKDWQDKRRWMGPHNCAGLRKPLPDEPCTSDCRECVRVRSCLMQEPDPGPLFPDGLPLDCGGECLDATDRCRSCPFGGDSG